MQKGARAGTWFHRKPDGYDEEGNPWWYLRRVRLPRLHRLYIGLRLGRGIIPALWLRILGWLALGVPLFLVDPWLTPLGPVVFEVTMIILGAIHTRRLREEERRNPPPPPPSPES